MKIMEALKLGMREQQYYSDLFQSCDIEGSGKVTGPKASELFLGSGLSPEVLKQITELCGAKRLGHFGRSQFYVALKLVALAQAGLPVTLDALNSGKDFPLPKFSSHGNEHVFTLSDRKKSCGEPDGIGVERYIDHISNAQLSGQLPPPPVSKKSHSRSLSGQYRGVVPDVPVIVTSQSSHFSSQGYVKDELPHASKSPQFSPAQSPPTSPASQIPPLKQNAAPTVVFASSLTNISSGAPAPSQLMTSSMDSVDVTSQLINPTSLVSDGGHVNPVALSDGSGITRDQKISDCMADIQTHHGQVQHIIPKPHHHLQCQENDTWTMFEDEENHLLIGSGVKQYCTLEPPNFDTSSISSESESVDDVWTVTDEQREYYINQFKTMQPDLTAVITGPVAKHFFEKSKLPILELSKIWQLSDLNCDGALSLEEFCIAMHLVVLRRNDIELPEHLPISLMPYSTLVSDEPFAMDLPQGSTLKRATPPSPQQNIAQWTGFVSESSGSSDVHSPTHLANFDFTKFSADPFQQPRHHSLHQELRLVQPVPAYVHPDAKLLHKDGSDRGRAFSVPVIVRDQMQLPLGSNLEGSSLGGSKDVVASYGHCPPTPPPRPPHGRSMSVDVKSCSQLIAPAIPPRVSPKEVQSALKMGEMGTAPTLEPKSIMKSAGQTHRRSVSLGIVRLTGALPYTEVLPESSQAISTLIAKALADEDDASENATRERLQPKPALMLRRGIRDHREIQIALQKHRESITLLTRLNSELNQELQEVMEQRIALEIQLEHLRPFSS